MSSQKIHTVATQTFDHVELQVAVDALKKNMKIIEDAENVMVDRLADFTYKVAERDAKRLILKLIEERKAKVETVFDSMMKLLPKLTSEVEQVSMNQVPIIRQHCSHSPINMGFYNSPSLGVRSQKIK